MQSVSRKIKRRFPFHCKKHHNHWHRNIRQLLACQSPDSIPFIRHKYSGTSGNCNGAQAAAEQTFILHILLRICSLNGINRPGHNRQPQYTHDRRKHWFPIYCRQYRSQEKQGCIDYTGNCQAEVKNARVIRPVWILLLNQCCIKAALYCYIC